MAKKAKPPAKGPKGKPTTQSDRPIRIGAVGQTRAGKSTLVNAILGDALPELTADGTVEFVFKIEGAVRDLEVFDLVQTLESMTVALQEANRTVNPETPDIRVAVKPIAPGSYEIHYALSYLQEHLPLLAMAASSSPGTLQQISEVLSDLGVIKRFGVGVLDAINKLRGKPTKIEQVKPNEYKVESDKGSALVNGDVKNLLQNPIIIESLHVIFQAPANAPGVTDVKTFLASDPVNSAVTVTKEIAETLRDFAATETGPPDDIKENVSRVWLNPHRGPFTGEPGQWWFTRGGGAPFRVTIRDKDFLEKYGEGNPRLNAEDLLEVDLLERQKLVNGKLTTSYVIEKVLNYKPGAKQRKLKM